MSQVTRIPDPLQWWEGMLLAPQHMQQQDIYQHEVLQHRIAQVEPYYWGVSSLSFDRAQLAAGKLVINEVTAVMPDGLVVQYPSAGSAAGLVTDLAGDQRLKEGKTVKIHLVVPVRAEGAASQASPIQRFESLRPTLALDENTGQQEVEIHRMRARLELYAEEEMPGRYVALPLLEVRRDPAGHFECTEYHPPLLRLDASGFLGEAALQRRLETLLVAVRAKARELAGTVDLRGTDTGELNSRYQVAIQALMSALPPLEVLVRSGCAHPFRVYLALAALSGQTAALRPDGLAPLPEDYVHNDLAPGFNRMLRDLAATITAIKTAYQAVAFTRVSAGVFEYPLPADLPSDRLLVEFRPQASQTPETVERWLGGTRIASAQLMDVVESRRTTGAEVEKVSEQRRRELQLPDKGLLVEMSGRDMEVKGRLTPGLARGQTLRISGPAGGEPREVVIYIPRNTRTAPARPGGKPNG
jgi:type VI secretion system protein ImpJ